MRYLLDTGVLLRLVNRNDSLHPQVRAAVRELKRQRHSFVAGLQNMAEFWNVSTRPASARGGLGLTPDETLHRLRIIERAVTVLVDAADTYDRWRDVVVAQGVRGVQVHDARLAALMGSHSVTHLLTLNKVDFARYTEIVAVAPPDVVPSPATPSP